MIFLDTGAQFALISERDKQHGRAEKIFEQLSTQRSPIVTTDYVIDELLTLLSMRLGKQRAIEYSEQFPGSEISLIFVTTEDFYEARSLFERYRDKEWSFTDCVSFAVMKRLGITEAFTFDRHFTQAGFRQVK